MDWRHALSVDHVGVDAGVGEEEADQVGVTTGHRVMQGAPAPGPQGEVGVTGLLPQDGDHVPGAALHTGRQQPSHDQAVLCAQSQSRVIILAQFSVVLDFQIGTLIALSEAELFHLLHINDTKI